MKYNQKHALEARETLKKVLGFSLIELLIVLLVASITLALSANAWQHTQTQRHADNLSEQVATLLKLARAHAIIENTLVTLCPSLNGTRCAANASAHAFKQWIIFTDSNKNKALDSHEQLLHTQQLKLGQFSLSIKPSNRSYFRFEALGITHGTMGSVLICHKSKHARRKLTLSLLGRVTRSYDQNGDGVHKERSGKPLNCGV